MRCDGASTVEFIVAALAIEYEIDRDELAADVVQCLEDLRRRHLIVSQRFEAVAHQVQVPRGARLRGGQAGQ